MKIALVTGANSGFGLLTSLELMQSGFHVVATMRNTENRKDLVQQAEQMGLADFITILPMDVTKSIDVTNVKEIVEERYGKLDILINNAGYCQGGFIEDLSLEEWENQQKTNVSGTFTTIKIFLPLLEKSVPARIINISSVSGYFGFPGMSAYCSSKFALEGMSESLRIELLPKNIYVSLIQPASYQTKIWEKGLEKVSVIESDSTFRKQIYEYATNAAMQGSDPMEVAKLVVRVSKKNKPKFRYPIGKGARSLSFLKRVIPWSIIEKAVIQKLK